MLLLWCFNINHRVLNLKSLQFYKSHIEFRPFTYSYKKLIKHLIFLNYIFFILLTLISFVKLSTVGQSKFFGNKSLTFDYLVRFTWTPLSGGELKVFQGENLEYQNIYYPILVHHVKVLRFCPTISVLNYIRNLLKSATSDHHFRMFYRDVVTAECVPGYAFGKICITIFTIQITGKLKKKTNTKIK